MEVISDGSINACSIGYRCWEKEKQERDPFRVDCSSDLAFLPYLHLFGLTVATSRCVALWTLIHHYVNPRKAACALVGRY
jgi:hypothetical protein